MGIESRCDLVLLSWNHLECTRPCVESILAHTALPSRLIIVDQNSDGETQHYLRSIHSSAAVQVEVLLNPANVGYPRGMNLGLARATAPFVCFLNNDILVPPGWLEELIAVAESDPSIGTVCPTSNTFDIHPPAGTDWLAYARTRSTQRGQWIEIPYGEGFCLLARTGVMQGIGGFDETTYEQIYFEDADLGRRIQAEGLRCVMAEGTYVWHHGGKTMANHPDRLRLFEENKRRFLAKWGPEGRHTLFVAGSSHPKLEALMRSARSEANRGGKVWILMDGFSSQPPRRHLEIRIQRLNRWVLPWKALWKSLTKKKKFEVIYTDVPWLRWVLVPLRFIHQASIGPIAQ